MKDSKGRFTAGNPGRPKGTGNRVTQSLRANVQKLLEDNYEQVVSDLKKLSPKDRTDVWCKLLEFALPRLNRTEISEPPTDLQQLMTLTPEERRTRIIQIQSQINNNKSA